MKAVNFTDFTISLMGIIQNPNGIHWAIGGIACVQKAQKC